MSLYNTLGLDVEVIDDRFRERFWSKVAITGPDDCWLWTAYIKPEGYGQFMLRKGRFCTASRVAYVLSRGAVDVSAVVCHRCDDPPCCNPSHLFAGTQVDNTIDCISKGRGNRSRGERHPHARLTTEDVRAIRSTEIRYGDKSRLARQYGVSARTISHVLEGETWGHVA